MNQTNSRTEDIPVTDGYDLTGKEDRLVKVCPRPAATSLSSSTSRGQFVLARLLLGYIEQLQAFPFEAFQTLGVTLHGWRDEVA